MLMAKEENFKAKIDPKFWIIILIYIQRIHFL